MDLEDIDYYFQVLFELKHLGRTWTHVSIQIFQEHALAAIIN